MTHDARHQAHWWFSKEYCGHNTKQGCRNEQVNFLKLVIRGDSSDISDENLDSNSGEDIVPMGQRMIRIDDRTGD